MSATKEALFSTLFTLDRSCSTLSVRYNCGSQYGQFQESIYGTLFYCLFVHQFVQSTVGIAAPFSVGVLCNCQVSVTFVFKCLEVSCMLS